MRRHDHVDLSLEGCARRRHAVADIKLLRVSLSSGQSNITEGIGTDWIGAQPSENLSPARAGEALKCLPWLPCSKIRERYRKLMLRFPPEQFRLEHMEWRPAEELIGSAVNRLNWYWQSGLTPGDELADGLASETQEWVRSTMGGSGELGAVASRLGESLV